MRKLSPWTLLRRRLQPIADELDRATPWRIEPPETVETWLLGLTWNELQLAYITAEALCEDPPRLEGCFGPLVTAVEGIEEEEFQERMVQQVMHRLIFALDLARRMPKGYRDSHDLTGIYRHDATEVLVRAWRTSSARYWAKHFGPLYCVAA